MEVAGPFDLPEEVLAHAVQRVEEETGTECWVEDWHDDDDREPPPAEWQDDADPSPAPAVPSAQV
jgi:hypothetical protein